MTTQGNAIYFALPIKLKLFAVCRMSIMTFFETLATICIFFVQMEEGNLPAKGLRTTCFNRAFNTKSLPLLSRAKRFL
jgi:hypothetical protein